MAKWPNDSIGFNVEFFRSPNIDWLGKKWYFLGFSLIFSVAGVLSMLFWHGIPLGVDFRGGTDAYVKFAAAPNVDQIRSDLDRVGIKNARVQPYNTAEANSNEVLISLSLERTAQAVDLTQGKNTIIDALEKSSPAAQDPANKGKQDLNNAPVLAIENLLVEKDPLKNGGDRKAYGPIAQSIKDRRDKDHGGVLRGFDDLNGAADARVLTALRDGFFLSNFGVRNVEIVGPQVGKQLQNQAMLAVLYSLAGMLVYLWFRFELIYGVAAVVACFHDTLITVGAFSLTNKEITLTVIAAILTLVGYSMNDTIVIFDRIRENLKLMRRERLDVIVNRSINQTLSRTILTSGLTFLTVLSLYLFGGEVLHGFSFALVIGILIGTYSSIAVAAPMLVAYQEWRGRQGQRTLAPVTAAEPARKQKVRAKA
jgi:preprotein translocase subunit SecF